MALKLYLNENQKTGLCAYPFAYLHDDENDAADQHDDGEDFVEVVKTEKNVASHWHSCSSRPTEKQVNERAMARGKTSVEHIVSNDY